MSEEALEKLHHPPPPTPPPGTCYKDRYSYINNRPDSPLPGSPEFQGLIPSMVNDFTQIRPDHVFAVAMGDNVPGVQTQTCEDINETFINYNNKYSNHIHTIIFLMILIILMGVYIYRSIGS